MEWIIDDVFVLMISGWYLRIVDDCPWLLDLFNDICDAVDHFGMGDLCDFLAVFCWLVRLGAAFVFNSMNVVFRL